LSAISALSVGCFLIGGINAGLGAPYFAGLAAVTSHYVWQLYTLDINNPKKCWDIFTANRYLGLLLTVAIILGK
jgi:4-hydroxybenzoate polyprenyltransferase